MDTQDTSDGCQADMFCLDVGLPDVSSTKSPGSLCDTQDTSDVWQAEIYGDESNKDENDYGIKDENDDMNGDYRRG